MTIEMILFTASIVLFLTAYCWFYKPKNFYGGYPAELWQESERMQGEKARTEVATE